MAHMNVVKMPYLPTMRLQVWHRSDLAPTQEDNRDLAVFLGSFDTGSWNPQPAEVSTVPFWSHSLVPIEVDIKYRPTSYYNLPEASVELCRFFRDTVQAHVGEFFNGRHTTALLANMYPVGDDVTENVKAMLLRAKLLQPLVIQSRTYAETCRISNRSMLKEGVILAAEISAHALELQGVSTTADSNAIKDKVLSIASLLQGNQETPPPKGLVEAWSKSLISFREVHLFSKKVQICIDRLNGPEGVNTPDLYDGLASIRGAILQFSAYQKSSHSIIRQLQEHHENQNLAAAKSVAVGLGSTAFGSLAPSMAGFDSSYVSMGVAFLIGCLAAGTGPIQLWKCFRNGKEVVKFSDALEDLQTDLRKAQFAFGILFCNHTLQMPFSWLADARGDEVLEGLGIDISKLKNEQYSEKFALETLQSLRKSYSSFEKLRDSIGQHAGLKECTEATIPSSTPDGNGDPMDLQED